MQVVPEPVDKWQNIGDGHHNVLQAFYDTPDRYAYTFQNYVFVTRMMQVTVLFFSFLFFSFLFFSFLFFSFLFFLNSLAV